MNENINLANTKEKRHWTEVVGSVVALFGAVITLAAAMLFELGQSYQASFYYIFGVGLDTVAPSTYSLMGHGLSVGTEIFLLMVNRFVGSKAFYIFLALLVFALVLRVVGYELDARKTLERDSQAKNRRKLELSPSSITEISRWFAMSGVSALILAAAMLFVAFISTIRLVAANKGQESAERYYREARTKVILNFRSEAFPKVSEKVKILNDAGALRLLTETKDVVVVFAKPCSEIKTINSFMVPLDQIADRYSEPAMNPDGQVKPCQPETNTPKSSLTRKRSSSSRVLRNAPLP